MNVISYPFTSSHFTTAELTTWLRVDLDPLAMLLMQMLIVSQAFFCLFPRWKNTSKTFCKRTVSTASYKEYKPQEKKLCQGLITNQRYSYILFCLLHIIYFQTYNIMSLYLSWGSRRKIYYCIAQKTILFPSVSNISDQSKVCYSF